MKKVVVAILILGLLFFVFIFMNNSSGTLNQADAIAHLKAQVGNFNEKDGFISRLNNLETEEKTGSFVAELKSCDKIEPFYDGDIVRQGSEQKIHQSKMCWVFNWKNMLAGGYVAYLDANTGELLCVKQIIEG